MRKLDIWCRRNGRSNGFLLRLILLMLACTALPGCAGVDILYREHRVRQIDSMNEEELVVTAITDERFWPTALNELARKHPEAVSRVAIETKNPKVREAAFKKLLLTPALADIAINCPNKDARIGAIRRMGHLMLLADLRTGATDPTILIDIAANEHDDQVAVAAFDEVDAQNCGFGQNWALANIGYLSIASNNQTIRRLAIEKLRALEVTAHVPFDNKPGISFQPIVDAANKRSGRSDVLYCWHRSNSYTTDDASASRNGVGLQWVQTDVDVALVVIRKNERPIRIYRGSGNQKNYGPHSYKAYDKAAADLRKALGE